MSFLTYDQWDMVADSVLPVLLLICIAHLIYVNRSQNFSRVLNLIARLGLSIAVVYFIMFSDEFFQWWPQFGLDYSTHTAFTLVFIVYFNTRSFIAYRRRLNNLNPWPWVAIVVINTLAIAYAYLMIYQQYHSLADIVSTAVIVTPTFLLIQLSDHFRRKAPVDELIGDCD